ncbi:hypothetical protein [Methanofollis tationis]|uniref:Uncharacterized protein n=1 Tax=Methanofollis tationis TaxID=81417 RepID=A0A7K4HMM2_9EURY|nr:hypothetical protein [Methanofollis tationis]NVO66402.1 hypothetical protein [Methanofollis tationis]
MAVSEAIKRRIAAVEEGRNGTGVVCVAISAVYPDSAVPPTETIFSTPAEARAAAVLRKAGRPVPGDRVICLNAIKFAKGAPEPRGWIVSNL